MSDRTYLSGYLYNVADGTAEQVANIFHQYGLTFDIEKAAWTGELINEMIVDDIPFLAEQWRCGDGRGLADELEALGATFMFHEDPAYEWLGDLYAFDPEFGAFQRPCNADGDVVVTEAEYLAMMRSTHTAGQLVDAVSRAFGVGYLGQFERKVEKLRKERSTKLCSDSAS